MHDMKSLAHFAVSTALIVPNLIRARGFRVPHHYFEGHVGTTTSRSRLWHGIKYSATTSLLTIRGGVDDLPILLPHLSLPSSFNQELRHGINTAILSVLASCRVTRLLQPTTNSNIATIAKQDASPVTVGDFASQATALKILHNQFPADMFIAEEGSCMLRADDDLFNKVWDAVRAASEGIESICIWKDKEELFKSIDYGQGDGPCSSSDKHNPRRRVWCLDPIDGTKGFLRGRVEGGQYCIALALLQDGVPVVSILGCPNQPVISNDIPNLPEKTGVYGAWSEAEINEIERDKKLFLSNRGCLFVAVHGCGCYEVSIHDLEQMLFNSSHRHNTSIWKQLHVTSVDTSCKKPSQATFCLGVERGFSDPDGTVLQIAQMIHGNDALVMDSDLNVPDIKNSFRLDGQGKYGILARGEAEYFLRLPKPGYVDWVWDVAAGYLVLKEAGGIMTDVNGNAIDFSGIGVDRNAKLPESVQGLLGSCGGVFHDVLVNAYASKYLN